MRRPPNAIEPPVDRPAAASPRVPEIGAQQRRLAGAVVAQYGDDLALADRQRHAAQRPHAAVGDPQARDLEQNAPVVTHISSSSWSDSARWPSAPAPSIPASSSTPPTAPPPCASPLPISTWSAAGSPIYGLDPSNRDPDRHGLEPALELRSYVADVKRFARGASAGYGRRWQAPEDTWVGVLPIGYGDGVRRGLTNNAEVLVGGRRYPLVGTVSMDNITIDLGPETEVEPGAEAVLIGRQGEERILAEEVAERLDTINYEVTCGISVAGPAARPGMSRAAEIQRRLDRIARPAGRARCARRDRGLGRRRRRSGMPRSGGTSSTSTSRCPPAAEEEAVGEIARRGRGHFFLLSDRFKTWRAAAPDRSWQADVTALRGPSIEADLAASRLHRQRNRGSARRRRADRSAPRPRRPRRRSPAGRLPPRSSIDDPLRLLRAARLGAELELKLDREVVELAGESAASSRRSRRGSAPSPSSAGSSPALIRCAGSS